MIKRWFKKHKTLLITFAITSVIFTILTSIQLTILMDNLDGLKLYIETGTITKSMYTYAIIVCINLLVGAVWLGLFAVLLWKVVFPNNQTVKNAFCLNELEFLINMPSSMRKGLSRKDE